MSTIAASALLALVSLPQPQRFPAEVEDAYALRVNPAGLAFGRGSELRLLYGHDRAPFEGNNQIANGLGAYGVLHPFSGVGFAAGYERDWRSDFDDEVWRLGTGFGGGWASIGFSYARSMRSNASDFDLWSGGLSLRPHRYLALGYTAADIGEQAGRRSHEISMAVRPGWERLLVSGVWRLTEDEPINDDTFDLAGRVEVEVIPGLRLGAGINNKLDTFFQLGVDFGYLSSGGFLHIVQDQLQVGGELVFRTEPANSIFSLDRVVVLDLAGSLVADPELDILRGAMKVVPYGGVPRLLETLAQKDDVRGVYLRIGNLSIGWAKAEEIRRAISTLTKTGRRADCFLTGGEDLEYFIASACTEIIVAPPSFVRLDGLASTRLYFGEALGRIGVRFEVERIGPFKNAPDTFTRSDMSEEERGRLSAWLDAVEHTLVRGIAEGRQLSEDEARATLDEGVFTASAAKHRRLVDNVLYPDEIQAHLNGHYDGFVVFGGAKEVLKSPSPRPWASPPAVAVVHVDAAITSGRSSASPLGLGRTVGARTLISALEKAGRSNRIKAVVLRVDSPGGDAVASDLLAHAVAKLATRKPVIASFGDVAASGGYYLAAPAQRIFAEATSLTGSIGIYSVKLDVSSLLKKLGVGVEFLTRGAFAGQMSPYRSRSEAATRVVKRALEASYSRFLETVADGRDMTVEQVHSVAEGRIFSGQDAVEVGLVDEIGGLKKALLAAVRAAGLDPSNVAVMSLPEQYQAISDPVSALLSRASTGGRPKPPPMGEWLGRVLGRGTVHLGARLPLLIQRTPLALLPYVVEVE